jgi:integrase
VLIKMLRLAHEHNKLARLPIIHKLKVSNVRQGFFEEEMFEQVCRFLRPDYQEAVTIAKTYGWRMQSEILMLAWRRVDFTDGALRLDRGTTKNDDGRLVSMTPEVRRILSDQRARVRALEQDTQQVIPWVFPHLSGRHRGQRIQDFKKAWKTACRKAGCSGMLRHDFRRTAVRNMERVGVARSVATEVTGHRSESVYRRYAIVSDADLQEVVRKLTGIVSGIVSDMPAQS